MAETERPPSEAAKALRDISQSGSRQRAGDDREDELMRLADDPLMIRNFLARQESASLKPLAQRGELSASTALHLQLSHDTRQHAGLKTMYAQRERKLDPSLAPEAFAPSAEDREQAISSLDVSLPVEPSVTTTIPVLAAFLGLLIVCALSLAIF
jgi:hypothetical protein